MQIETSFVLGRGVGCNSSKIRTQITSHDTEAEIPNDYTGDR